MIKNILKQKSNSLKTLFNCKTLFFPKGKLKRYQIYKTDMNGAPIVEV